MHYIKTIETYSTGLYKDKGSKFIALAFPVQSLEQVEQKLETAQQTHPKASHHCYAYKLGHAPVIERSNDDGEPSGSAGKPILGQLHSMDITNALVVVVRYYGGTKLGVGGLQTAYKSAARMALESNQIIVQELDTSMTIAFPFDLQGKVYHVLESIKATIIEKRFDTQGEINILVPNSKLKEFESFLQSNHRVENLTKNQEFP